MMLSTILLVFCIAVTSGENKMIFRLGTGALLQRSNPISREDCHCGPIACGLPNREHRVLGGKETGSAEYPWLAYMTYRGKVYCGATLLNDWYLITAGHCIHKSIIKKVIVHLGMHQTTASESTKQELKIGDYWVHPNFSRPTFESDIAVIKLASPVRLNSHVRPACLTDRDHDLVGKNGLVAGWGRTAQYSKTSTVPRSIEVPIISNAQCRTKTNYKPEEISDNMFCAGFDEGRIDACQGDSGGPLMLDRKTAVGGSKFYQTGIVSWGQGCGKAGYPGIYTRVGKFVDFIKDKMGKGCVCS